MFLSVLTWGVLIGAVWWFLKPDHRPARPAAPPSASPGDRPRAPAARAIAGVEPIVGCAHCGVHVPASEAARDVAGRAFCCRDHLVAGPRRAH